MILVDVFVPSINQTFDFMLDENQPIQEITLEMSEILAKYLKSEIDLNTNPFKLYLKNDHKLLRSNSTLYLSDVHDGSTLMLI